MAVKAPVLDDDCDIGKRPAWRGKFSSKNGPVTMAKLAKAVDEPRDMVMQALGRLAREDKICIEEEGRGRIVSLRPCEA